MNPLFSGMGGLDPSKMSPQTIAEISALMRTLSPEQIMKMQSLMHNAMAGFNVTKEMQEFEASLPASFREKMARIAYLANGVDLSSQNSNSPGTSDAIPVTSGGTSESAAAEPTDVNEARLIILRSVANKMMAPEEALKVLFPEG